MSRRALIESRRVLEDQFERNGIKAWCIGRVEWHEKHELLGWDSTLFELVRE